jgi:hypothetical protein
MADKATAEQLRAAWGPFQAQAGTYEISGANLTTHPQVAKNSALEPGAFTVYSYKIDGPTLTLAATKTSAGPPANPVTMKLTRVEMMRK